MAIKTIVVVEDEEDICELLNYVLKKEGYNVITVDQGNLAYQKIVTAQPALVLLDIMLPEVDGFEVCRHLKSDPRTQHIPILMMTAKSEETDVVTGLELGADDYIVKPFSPKVLVARIRAALRRGSTRAALPSDKMLEYGNLRIHPGRHEVLIDGQPILLTSLEFKVLYLLAGRPGWVFSRNQIVDATQGEAHDVTDRSVDVVIVTLRRKLGEAARLIETVRGVGYRFADVT